MTAVLFLSACSMGSSTSSLYSALAKTVSRPALPPPCDSNYNPGNDLDLDQDPADPSELLQECKEVLRNRPAQLQRAFVQTGHGDARQAIRVMQWNVLAQGINLHLNKEMTLNDLYMTYVIIEKFGKTFLKSLMPNKTAFICSNKQ